MFRRFRGGFRRKPALEVRARELQTLLLLTPRAFELAVADLLVDMGYTRVKVSGGPGDLGADITCRSAEGKTTIVQCKQYAPGRTVGSKELQSFIGMAFTHHKAERGLYVTTAGYTTPARELSRRHAIELLDGDRLAELLLEHRGPGTGADDPLDYKTLVESGVVDPNKLHPPMPAAHLPDSPQPIPLALGLPTGCRDCGNQMDWTERPLGWSCPSCGVVEDWESESGLDEWPERRLFHSLLAALNGRDVSKAATFFARGAAVTYLAGPIEALRSPADVRAWVAGFPLILQPLTAWRGTGAYNLTEMCDCYDRATGSPVGQITALLSIQGNRINQFFTNPT